MFEDYETTEGKSVMIYGNKLAVTSVAEKNTKPLPFQAAFFSFLKIPERCGIWVS